MTRPFQTSIALFILVISTACPTIDDDGETSEAGDETERDDDDETISQSATCEVSIADVEATWPAGRSIDVAVNHPDGASLDVTSDNALSIEAHDGYFTIIPAYVDEVTVDVMATCADGTEGSIQHTAQVDSPTWRRVAEWEDGEGPPAREYFSMWLDDGLTVFGGFHYQPEQFTPAADLWRFDFGTSTWSEILFDTSPAAVAGGASVPLQDGSGVLHYGGASRSGNDFLIPFHLIELTTDGVSASWTDVEPSPTSSYGTYRPSLFYDAPRQRYLTVGGQGASGFHMDVRAYERDTNSWLAPDVYDFVAPTGRSGFFWVHDEATERLIIFSGEQGNSGGWACDCATDAWALELAEDPLRWFPIAYEGDAPTPRRNGAAVLDPIGHRMLIWGGTLNGATTEPGLWALHLDRGEEAWYEVNTDAVDDDAPPVRTSAGGVYSAADDRAIFGFGNDDAIYTDLWALEF